MPLDFPIEQKYVCLFLAVEQSLFTTFNALLVIFVESCQWKSTDSFTFSADKTITGNNRKVCGPLYRKLVKAYDTSALPHNFRIRCSQFTNRIA